MGYLHYLLLLAISTPDEVISIDRFYSADTTYFNLTTPNGDKVSFLMDTTYDVSAQPETIHVINTMQYLRRRQVQLQLH